MRSAQPIQPSSAGASDPHRRYGSPLLHGCDDVRQLPDLPASKPRTRNRGDQLRCHCLRRRGAGDELLDRRHVELGFEGVGQAVERLLAHALVRGTRTDEALAPHGGDVAQEGPAEVVGLEQAVQRGAEVATLADAVDHLDAGVVLQRDPRFPAVGHHPAVVDLVAVHPVAAVGPDASARDLVGLEPWTGTAAGAVRRSCRRGPRCRPRSSRPSSGSRHRCRARRPRCRPPRQPVRCGAARPGRRRWPSSRAAPPGRAGRATSRRARTAPAPRARRRAVRGR